MKKILAIFAVMMIVAVSGCTGGDDTSSFTRGYGLEITNFTSSLGTIYSTQSTSISLRVENHGDTEALQANGLVLLQIPSDWDITQEKLQEFKKDIPFGSSTREPGSSLFRWSVKAPELEEGITRPDKIYGRVYYNYETKSNGNIIVYPESELLADAEAGRDIDMSSFEYSRGPISMSMSVTPDPVSVYSVPEIFSIEFVFTNVGGGVVYRKDVVTVDDYKIDESERNVLDMTVDITGLEIVDETCFDDIFFFGDIARTNCDVKIVDDPSTRQSHPIKVSATYGYYIEDTLDIDVIGRS